MSNHCAFPVVTAITFEIYYISCKYFTLPAVIAFDLKAHQIFSEASNSMKVFMQCEENSDYLTDYLQCDHFFYLLVQKDHL